MLSWDGRFLHLSDHLLRSWSLIPGKLHFDINVGLSLQFLYKEDWREESVICQVQVCRSLTFRLLINISCIHRQRMNLQSSTAKLAGHDLILWLAITPFKMTLWSKVWGDLEKFRKFSIWWTLRYFNLDKGDLSQFSERF